MNSSFDKVKSAFAKGARKANGIRRRILRREWWDPEFAADVRAMQASLMQAPPWCIDRVELSKDSVEIRGWAIAPRGGPSGADFAMNGQAFDSVEYPRRYDEIARVFWYIPTSRKSGFCCRKNLADGRPLVLSFKYQNRMTNEEFKKEQNYYYLVSDDLPLPSAENRRRVHGNAAEDSFRVAGYTMFVSLEQILRNATGRGYGDFKRILDWGCGCGRLARYFGQVDGAEITGVDIDGDNIEWCRANLSFGHFEEVPLHPPTNLPAASFDLLIGISVFTHLREAEQYEWLAELGRIAAPGAILLMSVHGPTAVAWAGSGSRELWRKLRSDGFVNIGGDPALGSHIQDTDYYRDVFHSADYVRAKWAKYFEIVEIIPGGILNHQDLVVMRKA